MGGPPTAVGGPPLCRYHRCAQPSGYRAGNAGALATAERCGCPHDGTGRATPHRRTDRGRPRRMRNIQKRLTAVVALSAAAVAGVVAFADVSAASATPAEGTVRGANASGAIKDNYIVVFRSGSAESRTVDSAAGTLTRRYGGAVKHAYKSAVH